MLWTLTLFAGCGSIATSRRGVRAGFVPFGLCVAEQTAKDAVGLHQLRVLQVSGA